jgi:hypothetical protein
LPLRLHDWLGTSARLSSSQSFAGGWISFETRQPYGPALCELRSFGSSRACEHATPIFSARQASLLKCAAGASRLLLFCHLSNYRATIFWLQP